MANESMERISERWHSDPGFRAQIETDAKAALAGEGLAITAGEAVVAVDTEDTVHLVFPPDPNADLDDDDLMSTVGGSCGETAFNNAAGRYSSTR